MAARLIRKFTEVVGLLGRGVFEQQVNNKLVEAVEVLSNLPSEKGKAQITVTLDLIYDKGVLQIAPTLKAKLPEDKVGGMIFWTHEGALSTQHPTQVDLEDHLRDTAPAKKELVTA